jgi:N-acetylglucosamine kinase-like BadF-type ATPase
MMAVPTQPKPGGIVVGVDAGGTMIRLVLLDTATGRVTAMLQGHAGPDGSPEPALKLLDEAFQTAAATASSVKAVCAGITKYSRAGVEQRWKADLAARFPHLESARCQVVPDFIIACHGAIPDGVGIGVIAGTGSVVYGEDERGGTVRVGGRGWEYGDEGSGAWITAEAVRRTLRALDGLEALTPLNDVVCIHLETRDPATVAETARRRAEIDGRGFLAPRLLEVARDGDEEAKNLFVGAAGWLAAQARAARSRLSFEEGEVVRVATIGGMWEAGALISDPFQRLIERWVPRAVVMAPEGTPVIGAARLAGRALTTPLPPP